MGLSCVYPQTPNEPTRIEAALTTDIDDFIRHCDRLILEAEQLRINEAVERLCDSAAPRYADLGNCCARGGCQEATLWKHQCDGAPFTWVGCNHDEGWSIQMNAHAFPDLYPDQAVPLSRLSSEMKGLVRWAQEHSGERTALIRTLVKRRKRGR